MFTVFSNMANHSFSCFVSFSINDWKKKKKVKVLNNSPFWEGTQSFICFCRLINREWVFFLRFLQMLSAAATIEVSVVYQQSALSCLLAGTYSFRKYLLSLFSQRINFYFKAKLVLRENSEFIVRDSELIRLLESPRSFSLCMLKK